MPSKKKNKLVRNRIPEIIEQTGANPITHIAGDDEYWVSLLDKLLEEVEEFFQNPCEEEMADILEVLYAIMRSKGYSHEQIEQVRQRKLEERGGFSKRIVLDDVN